MKTMMPLDVPSAGEVIAFHPRSTRRADEESSAAPTHVLLAAAEGLVRAGLRALLEHEPGIAVVAEAATGDRAVALAAERRPDVALVDVRMPGLEGVEVARRIVGDASLGPIKVLMLTERGTDADLFGALQAGASGVLVRDSDPAELRRAIRGVARGEAQLSPSFTRRLIEEFTARPDPKLAAPERLEELTDREREVMTLAAMGLSNREIAEQLIVSPATAKTHVSRVMVKLQARHRAKLVAIAYETGLVRPPGALARPA
jgi:DNA-binding NarL/FixJ family response regulator